jgi:membrane-bound lytic murein transglycosylase D
MIHLIFPRDHPFTSTLISNVHRNTLSLFSKQSLTKLTPQFISSAMLVVATFIYTPAHAESNAVNVMGEEITIFPDDISKPETKDLGNIENLGSIESFTQKKSGGNRLGDSLDSQLHDETYNQQEVIIIESDDLWQRIKDGYAIPDSTSSLVTKHENWYSSRPDYIRRMVERSQRYLFHIVEEVEKRGMPTEIALLPMIESAYNPQAYSTSRASGIWQFIPSTGKHFGLKQNWWIDNRRNVTIATDAALTYLQKLHSMFGSWDLALAAYNAGEGTVGRAIERNRKLGLATDYESLNLPPETRNYVPKLQAIKNLMTNPGKYGLKIQTIENTAYFTKVSAPAQIDAHLAAKLAEISDDEFLALNPSNNRPVITNNGEKHELLLPILSAQTFRDNLANYNKPLVSWQTYFAKRGERMESIASKFGIQLAKLRNVNNLPTQNKIKKSATILVPNGNKADFNVSKPTTTDDTEITQVTETDNEISANQDSANLNLASMESSNAEKVAAESAGNNKAETEPTKNSSTTHKVKRGETMQSIAKRYSVSVKDIMKSSSLKSSRIKAGQLLTINTVTTDATTAKYQVKSKSAGKTGKVRIKNSPTKSKIKSTKTKKKRHQ